MGGRGPPSKETAPQDGGPRSRGRGPGLPRWRSEPLPTPALVWATSRRCADVPSHRTPAATVPEGINCAGWLMSVPVDLALGRLRMRAALGR